MTQSSIEKSPSTRGHRASPSSPKSSKRSDPRTSARHIKHTKNSSFRTTHYIFAFLILYMGLYLFSRNLLSRSPSITSLKNNVLSRLGLSKAMATVQSGPGQLPTHFTLRSGDKIPTIALGTWRAAPGEVKEATLAALKVGYRHIDGAESYGNEAEVGEAIKESGIARKDIWLTSKLWNNHHAPEDVEPAIDESLAKLGTDYLDLYMIHWPVAFGKDGKNDVALTENPYPTWKKLEEMVEKGKVRNLGVANFNIRRLEQLLSFPLKVKPTVIQYELSYWNPAPELVKWSKDNGIVLEAYSPLGSQGKVKETLEVPEVKAISEELGITPAQVVISWHVQRGTVALPKSIKAARVEENFKITALPQEAFERLERAATSHPPVKLLDPTPHWGVDFWDVNIKHIRKMTFDACLLWEILTLHCMSRDIWALQSSQIALTSSGKL
ncbi:hypothetical protein BDN70DRAFT_880285 [Pholiota conissans]|uniref:NADP-dependent oxidoreductase domain-containing protein n=1 Tax=Pholiota conissans TaxID=109636 RepID=A0A9P6CSH0_9AGAR|nr:hypothetical protein BDN70DRAFT_880285 [Pholiota conissans]